MAQALPRIQGLYPTIHVHIAKTKWKDYKLRKWFYISKFEKSYTWLWVICELVLITELLLFHTIFTAHCTIVKFYIYIRWRARQSFYQVLFLHQISAQWLLRSVAFQCTVLIVFNKRNKTKTPVNCWWINLHRNDSLFITGL